MNPFWTRFEPVEPVWTGMNRLNRYEPVEQVWTGMNPLKEEYEPVERV